MAIRNRQEAEAILQNGGAPEAAKKEAQEYLDSLIIETPDATGLDNDKRKQVQKQNESQPRKPSDQSIADALTNNPVEITAMIEQGLITEDDVERVQRQLNPIEKRLIRDENKKGTKSADEYIEELKNGTYAGIGPTPDDGSNPADGVSGPVTETEADPGNTGDPTTDAENITEDIPGDKGNRHYRAVKSIWSAYYDGDFGPPGSAEAKEVAWYYTIDSLGKLASNIGRSLRNVGAAYVGGAIDDGEDKSEWQEHRDSLRKEATGMSKEDMGGAASRQATAEELSNEIQELARQRGVTTNQLIQYMRSEANKEGIDPNMKLAYLGFAASLAGAPVSSEQMVAMQGVKGLDRLITAAENWFKSKSKGKK